LIPINFYVNLFALNIINNSSYILSINTQKDTLETGIIVKMKTLNVQYSLFQNKITLYSSLTRGFLC